MKTEPIKLSPAFKDYLWGGTRLKTEFGMKSDLEKLAEAWELSCHPDGPSIVASGECAGMTLTEYLEKAGKSALGTHCDALDSFPVLIKLIDAAKKLSIQVHPTTHTPNALNTKTARQKCGTSWTVRRARH